MIDGHYVLTWYIPVTEGRQAPMTPTQRLTLSMAEGATHCHGQGSIHGPGTQMSRISLLRRITFEDNS